jgi:hypothetical protein
VIAKHVPMRVLSKSSLSELMGYLTDQQGLVERVGDIRITNCEAASLEAAVSEMLATQQLNTRSQADRTYHLIVSFQAGETPSPETLAAIEERICNALGFAGHQRVSVVHHDTDNLHVHIAVNKVHPTRLTVHQPYCDYVTLARVAGQCEAEFELKADNHAPRRTVGQGRAADMEQHAGIESLMSWVRRECLAELQAAHSWQALYAVAAEHGLALRERGAGLVFEAHDGTCVKASSVDHGLSRKALEDRLGTFEPAAGQSADQRPGPGKRYGRRPTRSRMDTTALFARYTADQARVATDKAAELAAARRRIRELESELAIHRRAAELLKERTDPKGGSRPSR